MVTRLRSFSLSKITKVTAFVLAVGLNTSFAVLAMYIFHTGIELESLFVEEYRESRTFMKQVDKALIDVYDTLERRATISEDVPYYYYAGDIRYFWTNSEDTERSFFEQFGGACYILENGEWKFGPGTDPAPVYRLNLPAKNYYKIYLAFPDDYMAAEQQKWDESRDGKLPYAIAAAVCMVLLVLLIIYLISAAGRSSKDSDIHLNKWDSIYTDIQAASFVFLIVLWCLAARALALAYTSLGRSSVLNTKEIAVLILTAVVTATASILCGLILLSAVRKLKAGTLIKHSLVYIALNWIYDYVKSLFDGRAFEKYPLTRSLFYRQLIFICASFVLVLLTFFFFLLESFLILLPPVLEIIMVYWYIKGNIKSFRDINEGFDISIREQIRSERMKVALITNVSHDLKTPLTSIISYVDLLSKEDGLSETARDYVRILSEKSARLSNMVSDLFDLAKSTSGNMPLEIENIDLKKLIEQTLADMQDKVEKSGLVMKVLLPEKPLYISADGKKLYRVFQNIIDNALKYSFKGTRVHITLEETDGRAVAAVKNTAGYEMDFTADEILQRFNRGDKSRTTEGSGLGLSIAESFTKVCGGGFKVDIDGDLFKVTISFPVSQKGGTVFPSPEPKSAPVPQQ